MSDVRDFRRERAAIAEAALRRVGGDHAEVARILDGMTGGFSPALHAATIALLPRAVATAFGGPSFASRVSVTGDLARLRELASRSTLILAPTHSSNLDSIVLGLVLGQAGMPPFAYAAGKHIFRNRLFAMAMRRLGAYCLDPDRRDRLYLRVVNVYVNELVARGYHTVVFPSGTRCRSGEVERAVKLGLLGAAVHVSHPVTIVPVTINYQVVLEAESLIGYYLAGRSHERIVGDELFVWGRLRDTAHKLASLDQRVAITFGDPIDPRASDGSWRSRVIDELTTAYRRDTVFFATHVVARALHDLGETELEIDRVHAAIDATCARIAAHPEAGRLWHDRAAPGELLDAALHAWASWHRTPPAVRRATGLSIASRELLLFYRNRTAHVPA